MDFTDFILVLIIIGVGFGLYCHIKQPIWYQNFIRNLKDKYQTK